MINEITNTIDLNQDIEKSRFRQFLRTTKLKEKLNCSQSREHFIYLHSY